MKDNRSMEACWGRFQHDLGTVTTGETVKFPAGVSTVKMGSTGSHTTLFVPGAREGDIVRIEATSAITFTSVAAGSATADQLVLGGNKTLAAYDVILLQRYYNRATGVWYWALDRVIDRTP